MSGQLESLTEHLRKTIPPRIFQFFDAQIDSGQLIRTTKSLGAGRYRMGVLRYEALLSWVNFPFREYPPALIYAQVMAWTDEFQNDLAEELNLGSPGVDMAFNHERVGDLIITVNMVDEITMKEAGDGPVFFRGKRWALELPEVYYATDLALDVRTMRPDDG